MDYRTLYKVNLWVYIITLGLYLTFYLGFLAEIFMIVVQIITVLFIASETKFMDGDQKDLLNLYFFLFFISILFGVGLPFIAGMDELMSVLIFYCVLPMINAAVLVRLLFLMQKKWCPPQPKPKREVKTQIIH